jgi:predicted transcriptional regulator
MVSHLNEKSETTKLLKVIDVKDRQLSEAKAFATKAKTLAESVNKEKSRLIESAKREKTINDLIAPLSKDQKEIMTDLLESVQTDRLQKSFDKYLPSVIDGNTPAKRKAVITEGTKVTGNREMVSQTNSSTEDDSNVLDIRRLAGLN